MLWISILTLSAIISVTITADGDARDGVVHIHLAVAQRLLLTIAAGVCQFCVPSCSKRRVGCSTCTVFSKNGDGAGHDHSGLMRHTPNAIYTTARTRLWCVWLHYVRVRVDVCQISMCNSATSSRFAGLHRTTQVHVIYRPSCWQATSSIIHTLSRRHSLSHTVSTEDLLQHRSPTPHSKNPFMDQLARSSPTTF